MHLIVRVFWLVVGDGCVGFAGFLRVLASLPSVVGRCFCYGSSIDVLLFFPSIVSLSFDSTCIPSRVFVALRCV